MAEMATTTEYEIKRNHKGGIIGEYSHSATESI